jgi:Holliday junction resolvase RusA-like endonuclease
MTDIIHFRVEGTPRSKQSFKYRDGGGYTPPLTRAWQDMVTTRAKEAMATHGWNKIDGPVRVQMTFLLPSKKRVDCDNLAKAVVDGLRHVCFTDDKQITALEIYKCLMDEWSGVEVMVKSTAIGRELFLK